MIKHNYAQAAVTLLHASPLEVVELAAHMPVNNHNKSDDPFVISLSQLESTKDYSKESLAKKLVHVLHHNSIAEHSMLSYLINGISRGVLQELVRHRVGIGYTVQSTRYSITPILIAFISVLAITDITDRVNTFVKLTNALDVFVMDEVTNATNLYYSLHSLYNSDEELFMKTCYSKGAREVIAQYDDYEERLKRLPQEKISKLAGDYIKHLVNDSWATSAVVTYNLRSLKTFLELRDSGAAWYQMQDLAKAIIEATPVEHMQLIYKNYKR